MASPPVAPVQYISFSTLVDQLTADSLLASMAQMVNKGVQTVHLLLSTPGGSVNNGITVYNVLRGLPLKLITHNVGAVDSIGNVIFLAGDERYAVPNSTFMFHGVGFDVQQAVRFEEKTLRERLSSILADQNKIGAIIADRTNLSTRQVRGLFRQAVTKDPVYAKANGFIDDIRDVQVPPGGPVNQFVFK